MAHLKSLKNRFWILWREATINFESSSVKAKSVWGWFWLMMEEVLGEIKRAERLLNIHSISLRATLSSAKKLSFGAQSEWKNFSTAFMRCCWRLLVIGKIAELRYDSKTVLKEATNKEQEQKKRRTRTSINKRKKEIEIGIGKKNS